MLGTTVATNALLERTGVRTLLLVTEGFEDLPTLRTMARPDLFDPDRGWPAGLATRVVGVRGRRDAQGRVVTPLVVPDLRLDDIDAVAIALLHSGVDDADERALAAALYAAKPGLYVSLGSALTSAPGYLARIETALVDAALTPVLQHALRRDRVPSSALAIRSDGALCPAHDLRAPDAVLSGPAGGVLAVQALARALDLPGAVGLDMGGTSTDVTLVDADALPWRHEEALIAGVGLARPMLRVDTIAAGGGSILANDGVTLRVGPRSAGADPGPQSRGRGGPPTLTDAALAAGLVDPTAYDPPLDLACVDLPGAAEDFLDVAREAMAAAVSDLAGQLGVDVRRLPLVAYGGAAGQHAAFVAARLGIDTVLVHPCASVFSAWGQAWARRARWARRSPWTRLADTDLPGLVAVLRAELGDAQAPVTVTLRPPGTDQAATVPWSPDVDLEAAYRAAAARTAASPPQGPLEVVDVAAIAWRSPPTPPHAPPDPWGLGSARREGPCRIDGARTSVVVPVGWTASLDRGVLRLDRQGAEPPVEDLDDDGPRTQALWASRFFDVATRAGEHLRRAARSVSVRDRRDFSFAVFDGRGRLVANAPHVPVHLGAMGETVRDLLANALDPDGRAWLTNDPAAGGSHLPDLTVMTPFVHDGIRFVVASRAHHADVGGSTPGSMPPFAAHRDEEGAVWRRVPLTDPDGRPRDLAAVVAPSRQPEVVADDLRAQIAANAFAIEALVKLGPGALLARRMAQRLATGPHVVARLAARLRPGRAATLIDGVPLVVAVRPEGHRLVVDLTGTGGPHPGNRNAPKGVVRAVLLYVLRVLAADDTPLHEGLLDGVTLRIPPNSLVDPPDDAAVAGGNVETSQALADLMMAALDVRAAGQGTMNNLTIGGEGWSLYETLGGGSGAREGADGLSGLQVHMTNTHATDPEIVERRLPLRLKRFALRRGTGGAGRWRGGDGVVRTWELLAPATAACLASRRDTGAPGAHGGASGGVGAQHLRRSGTTIAWDGAPVRLSPGDLVEVCSPGGGGWGAPPAEAQPTGYATPVEPT